MWHVSKQGNKARSAWPTSPPTHLSDHIRLPRRWMMAWLAFLLLSALQPASINAAPTAQSVSTSRITNISTFYVLTFEGSVTPVLENYLNQAIHEASTNEGSAIILQLDTPGGSVEVTKSIIQSMLASPVPLIVYVAPNGSRAGSAGTFITLAAHIAAMAPSTSIGAASPVDMGGGEIDATMAAKVTNILSADIENLATRRGEAATEWAIAAVQEAAAATAQQALELGVIDLIASDIPHLIEQINGRTVELATGSTVLNIANAQTIEQEMSFVQRALNLLVDPSIATILLSLGVLGIITEIRTPGFGFPGILGIICLVLAFYGLGQLDANLTGLTFMVLALILFVTEAFTPSFGLLTIGGIIAFLLGGSLLFNTPGLSTPWGTLIALAVVLGGFTLFISYLALRAQTQPALTGTEALIGAIGITKGPLRPGKTGSVFVYGEWWNAIVRSGEIPANAQVRVTERNRMTLTVVPDEEMPGANTITAPTNASTSTPTSTSTTSEKNQAS